MKSLRTILFFISGFILQAQNFEEVAIQSGIDHVFNQVAFMGGGGVFFDYNNDGWEDLYITSGLGKDVLYRNKKDGTFIEVEAGFEITANYNTTAAVSGDFNNDGYRDLFVTTWRKLNSSALARNLLFVNNGDGSFTEVGVDSGIVEEVFTMGAAVLDYNKDGYLDIYAINNAEFIGNGQTSQSNCFDNFFYQNNGDGTFTEKATALNLNNVGCGLAVMPTDFDQDNDQDIYLANDYGTIIASNALFQNNYPTLNFSNVSESTQTDIAIFAMGLAYGDIDKDQDFDYYITNIGRNVLLENDGTNTFNDISNSAGVENIYALDEAGDLFTTGWGTAFLDVNNDTWPDLFVANGNVESVGTVNTGDVDPNMLYINNKDKTFTEHVIAKNYTNRGRGMAYCDYDKDGDLDILVVVQDKSKNANPKTVLFKNQLNPNNSTDKNWVQFDLEGVSINRDAIGAKIELTVNGEKLIQEVHGQGSHCSQHSLVLHYGLAENNIIEEIKIIWSENYSQTFNDLAINKRYILKEGNDLDTDVVSGCTDPTSCNYNPNATVNDGSCQYLVSQEISGNTSSGFYKTDTYNYNASNGAQITWNVEGGDIVSGQGTNNIQVRWHFVEQGRISVIENSNLCASELIVNLHLNNLSEEVSMARLWNEALLEAIRDDYARPTVHARNLFHSAVAFYDAWAIYEGTNPYLVGTTVHNFSSELKEFSPNENKNISIKKAISYASYRLLTYRFKNSPGADESLERFNLIMEQLGFDTSYTSTNYESGDAAALGNYIAQTIINYGYTDNSREATDYDNGFYQPVNPALDLNGAENSLTGIVTSSRWQPLTFNTFIDQSGNLIEGATPEFLSPEWGAVHPFALSSDNKDTYTRDGNQYVVYHNPETPPQLNASSQDSRALYKWNFSLVSLWSSHLDPTDGVMWDISPRSIGNIDISLFPQSYADHPDFYKELAGGDISAGHTLNPKTGQPYKVQMVPRADYARVLAEFWADGPDSETPPGHWFTILNYVTDHELFERKFNGKGKELTPLEWDVKAYFILGGALHDAAVAAWGIKGWHDYIRPISAIRYMCELGQSTDNSLPNYNPEGIELKEGYIEVVELGDPLAGTTDEHIGKIKLKAWRGHDFITNATTDVAGVGWILAENWWPYQRPSFVTPPFAGFVSGHSTFSRAAAEVMTLITGDEYFPGGMGEFVAKKNEFLVFEKGPSVDVTLQWATYRDASDQTSLSRIWGGIHPPVDDIPGRLVGEKIGIKAYDFAIPYFESTQLVEEKEMIVFPNPVGERQEIHITNTNKSEKFYLFDLQGRPIPVVQSFNSDIAMFKIKLNHVAPGMYVLTQSDNNRSWKIIIK